MFKTFNKKRKKASEEMSLNITAMADIFTVLLVFLLKSFSTGSLNLATSQGLLLPEAQADERHEEALKIEVSENAILIEGDKVGSLEKFYFQKNDIGSDLVSKSLSQHIEQARKKQLKLVNDNHKDVKITSKVIVISDKKVPYKTLKTVLASAAVNGYTDFKLAVVRKE